jgi:hypothetical protein
VDLAEVEVCTGCGRRIQARQAGSVRRSPVQIEGGRDLAAGRLLTALGTALITAIVIYGFFAVEFRLVGPGLLLAMVGALLAFSISVVRSRPRPGRKPVTIVQNVMLAVSLVVVGAFVFVFVACLSSFQ